MDFEVWFYRGLIAVLLIIIWWMAQRWINKQEDKNNKFFELLDENAKAINKLNIILDSNSKICDLKHREIDQRMNKANI